MTAPSAKPAVAGTETIPNAIGGRSRTDQCSRLCSNRAITTATTVVEIERRNVEVATEQLELARERYRLGAAPFLELLDAEDSMAQAERDHLNALYRFHGAIWALEAATGARLRPES